MDASLTDEQVQMKESLRDFLESKGGTELARRYLEGDERVVDDLWDDLARMDYPALTVPVEHGGLGEDVLYLALVLEEAGRVAMPGPYPETMAFCVPLLAEAGTDGQRERYLPAVADGDLTMSFALYEDGTETPPDGIEMLARPTDGGYRLSGTKTLVPYGDRADVLLVAARTDDAAGLGTFLVDAADVEATRLDSLDRTRPYSRITLEELHVDRDALVGRPGTFGPDLERAIDRYTVAVCAMLVGAADRTVDGSVEHANEREQFGQPIGRFQAVKHRIADMWMTVRASRSLVYYAAWSVSNDREDSRRAVSAAKSYCVGGCTEVFAADVQNHGATGYTWDHDAHLYLRQARAWESFLGSPTDHRDRIAEERDI